MTDVLDIIILAKVVDNFGDIGVTWRLSKHLLHWEQTENSDWLKQSGKRLNLRLVTDNLKSFSNINSKINPDRTVQECDGVHIYDWNASDYCYTEFTKNPPYIILECFQCGYPEWMEKILFEDRVEHKVNIVMIDYLSAESWPEDFHCLKSLTRTAWVPKVNFMPGFTNKTGGLLLEKKPVISEKKEMKEILFFAYEKNWKYVIQGMNRALGNDVKVLVAGGAGQDSIIKAIREVNATFETKKLSFMDQENWDIMMAEMDAMIIRGEESMAQACQSGIPFIWQAYPQRNEYQIVKVNALLERMKPYFECDFEIVEKAWRMINFESEAKSEDEENAIFEFFSRRDQLRKGFQRFAESLYANGDLAFNLMTFIEKSIIIDKTN